MEGVPSDVTSEFTPGVPEEVPQEVPESLEAELADELPEAEPTLEAALPELQASRPPRVRKVRIKDTPPPKPEPGYWNDRLQEHRATQRAAKSERYSNLGII
mgnify:CR=1 FL=1